MSDPVSGSLHALFEGEIGFVKLFKISISSSLSSGRVSSSVGAKLCRGDELCLTLDVDAVRPEGSEPSGVVNREFRHEMFPCC